MQNILRAWQNFKSQRVALHPFIVFGIVGSAFAVMALVAKQPSLPVDSSADAGFARDMVAHHEQAVNMSFIVRENTDDEEIRRLAFDIINTQSVQIGMMSGWLQLWDLPQTSVAEPLVWAGGGVKMDHSSMPNTDSSGSTGAMMPGMATPEQIEQLNTLKDSEAGKQYLELMIAHHQGGIMMARAGLKLAKEPDAQRLAQTIVNGQQAEIEAMWQMLKDRAEN